MGKERYFWDLKRELHSEQQQFLCFSRSVLFFIHYSAAPAHQMNKKGWDRSSLAPILSSGSACSILSRASLKWALKSKPAQRFSALGVKYQC